MPDELGLDALSRLNDGTVIGAICVLLIVLIVYREVIYWPREIAKCEAKLSGEIVKRDAEIAQIHDAHDKTRSALLEEVRGNSEIYVMMREQMKSQATAVDQLLRLADDRQSTPRRRT